jgi:hypothetical protein
MVIVQFKKKNTAPYCHQVERLPLFFPALSMLAFKLITRSWNAVLEGPQESSMDSFTL